MTYRSHTVAVGGRLRSQRSDPEESETGHGEYKDESTPADVEAPMDKKKSVNFLSDSDETDEEGAAYRKAAAEEARPNLPKKKQKKRLKQPKSKAPRANNALVAAPPESEPQGPSMVSRSSCFTEPEQVVLEEIRIPPLPIWDDDDDELSDRPQQSRGSCLTNIASEE
eukprot:symbB.v1.2.018461.t1/scaffold1471.1/size116838/9